MSVKRSSPPLTRRSGEAEGSERLKERRRRGRRRLQVLLGILCIVCIGAFVWLTWQPYARISIIEISNSDPLLLASVESNLAGTYAGIVPRDSFFFVPKSSIRAAVLEANPRISALSIVRNNFTTLQITVHERVPIARWCGLQKTEGVEEYCYLLDAEGYVFAAADIASSTATLNSFALYDSLVGDVEEPLRATLAHAKQLPDLFDFAHKVGSLGSSLLAITIRNDEADLMLLSGTRVTYLPGTEEAVAADLMSVKEEITLTDGSLVYADFRFSGKVYIKRKNATVAK